MKNGVPNKKGGFTGGYRYIGNADEIFLRFFGCANPFYEQEQHFEQPDHLAVTVPCTLEELYNGCVKEISY